METALFQCTSLQDVASNAGACCQDKAERDGEQAVRDLNERLSSQIEARDQRLVAERASAGALCALCGRCFVD